ncbi:MAG: biotin--[acetyl-CoA-carboxylase] ligase [Alphaproteobacteria bacterium]|jgi:BirA family biotin operon repressor/biotin-[acetyl-CoA-carboxylase] ligase
MLETLGFKLIEYKEIDSTNLEALRLIHNKEIRHNSIILAEEQTAGKGRLKRNWLSYKGNLHCSIIIVDFKNFSQEVDYLYSYLSAIAVFKALKELGNLNIKLKWPNDILLDDKKLAGILIDKTVQGNKLSRIIIGIGVNIEHFPTDKAILYPATSLLHSGIKTTQKKLAFKILEFFSSLAFKDNYQLVEEFKQNSYRLGEKIEVRLSNNQVKKGIFYNLDNNGSLVLKQDEEGFSTISFGDVS